MNDVFILLVMFLFLIAALWGLVFIAETFISLMVDPRRIDFTAPPGVRLTPRGKVLRTTRSGFIPRFYRLR
jgi:hypothetical protein